MSAAVQLLALSILIAGSDPGELEELRGRVRLLDGGTTQAGLFPDLKSALAAADDGDHLVLEAGLYTGAGNVGLVVERDVVIRGRHGAAGSVIDCRESGRAFELRDADAVLQGLTIRRGKADLGGGVRVLGGTVVFQNVTFEGNTAREGGAIAGDPLANVVVSASRFLCNTASAGGALGVRGETRIDGCLLRENEATLLGGGIFFALGDAGLHVSRSAFWNNQAGDTGGAVAGGFLVESMTFDACTLIGNEAARGGGGVFSSTGEPSFVMNSLFVNNGTVTGAGAFQGSPAVVVNCTAIGNRSLSGVDPGGILTGRTQRPSVLVNCIVRENTSPALSLVDQQVQGEDTSFTNPDLSVLYSNVAGLADVPTNIDEDPLFVDPANGDYHIEPSSPCVDAGLAFSLLVTQQDIDGEPRIQGPSADIGADEVPVPRGR